MADLQTPTEATLLSTSNPATEYTTPTPASKEASTQVSRSESNTHPAATQTTAPVVNGDTKTTTNGVVVPQPTPTSSSVPVSLPQQSTTNGDANADDDTQLFSSSLISPEVSAILPEGYTLRPLRRSDYYGGMCPYLSLLHSLIHSPTLLLLLC
jgi:hypothetical protein